MTQASDLFQAPELTSGNVKQAMKLAGATSADLWKVKPEHLRFLDGFNGRIETPEYEAHIEALTQSIMANGYYPDKPIAGFVAEENGEQVIYVTDGHSRTKAVKRAMERGAPISTVPVVIKPKGTTMEDLTIALVTSNNGRPFTPLEMANIVKRLIDMGMSEKDVSQRLSISSNYVGDLLTLVGAPKAIRDMVIGGQVAATTAIKEIKTHGSKASGRLKAGAERAAAAGKTKVSAKHLVKTPVLRISGKINAKHKAGETVVTIHLDNPLDVELIRGNLVKLVISEDEL